MADRFNLDDYVPVNERLSLFRADHPTWGLICHLRFEGSSILARAEVTDETGRIVAMGHAEEVRDQGLVNKTSAVENAETSAWGRALACLGYEVKRSVASREEMEKVSGREVSTSTSSRVGAGPSQGQRTGEDNGPGRGNVTSLPRPSDSDVARHPANGPVLDPPAAIHARAKELKISEAGLREVILNVSNGRTRSAAELRQGEYKLVFAELEALAKAKPGA